MGLEVEAGHDPWISISPCQHVGHAHNVLPSIVLVREYVRVIPLRIVIIDEDQSPFVWHVTPTDAEIREIGEILLPTNGRRYVQAVIEISYPAGSHVLRTFH